MILKELSITGFLGVSFEHPAEFEFDDGLNVVIGPNNAGKSIVARALELLCLTKSPGNADKLPRSTIWQRSPDGKPTIDVAIRVDNPIELEWIADGELLRMQAEMQRKGDWVAATQNGMVKFEKNSLPLTNNNRANPHLQETGAYGNPATPQSAIANNNITHFINSLSFFDPIRATSRPAVKSIRVDGSATVEQLSALRANSDKFPQFTVFVNRLTVALNSILEPSGSDGVAGADVVAATPSPKLALIFKSNQDLPVFLEYIGTGIEQLVIYLTWFLQHENEEKIVIIEEPEAHLHPALLRRFVEYIRTFENKQLIITTHSSVLLDCEPSTVTLMRQHEDGSCRPTPCRTVVESHDALDAIGLTPSALLQSNCLIWVEGPTDRIYIRAWLLAWAKKEKNIDLIENADFSFVIYGGAILSQFDFDSEDDLVSMIYVNRFTAVMMDRDAPPGEDVTEPRKKRILAGAHGDDRRLPLVTEGREIEFDLPRDLLLQTTRELANIEASIDGSVLRGEKAFQVEIANAVETDSASRKSLAERVNAKKIAIAKKISEQLTAETSPKYIKDLGDFVVRSRQVAGK